MKISIFGLGYVGCVSLGCLAQNGHQVIGVDVNEKKVELINRGMPTIIEKDIDKIIAQQQSEGRIRATLDYREAVGETDVSIICVGTPSTEAGSLNLDFIYETARQIAEVLKTKKGYHLIAIRSTVLPGTNKAVCGIIKKVSGLQSGVGFEVVSNPEFLREGSAVQDYYNPPFTLVGSDSEKALCIMRDIYARVNGEFVESSIAAAEIIKYVNNSFHALKITFANEVGNICKRLGIDSHEVMKLFCQDKQLNISSYYFKPGFAYGGSCLPKDLKALKTLAHDYELVSPVLESIENSNQNHIKMATKLLMAKGAKRVAILGVAFKEGTDDLRYSPILQVIEKLLSIGCEVRVHDPYVNKALLIGANKAHIDESLPFLVDLMRETEQEIVEWAELVVINRKSASDDDMVRTNQNKWFVDMIKTGNLEELPNYEGLCW